LGALIAAFALPALAQDPAATATPAQDEAAAKTELYKKFTTAYNRGKEIKKADPNLTQAGNKDAYGQAAKEAYEFAKEYVGKYPSNPDAIFNFQKKYIGDYEKAVKEDRKAQLNALVKDKKFSEAFALGRQILADEPEDLGTNYDLALAGLNAARSVPPDEANNAETAKAARKAIQLIEGGATFVPGQPIAKKDETLSTLYVAYGATSIKTSPGEAVTAFTKASQLEGPAKSDPLNYYLLAVAYQANEYEKLAASFQSRCTTQEQRDGAECKAITDRLNLVVDRIIDAYARSIAYIGTNPAYQRAKDDWMKSLTEFYKYRHEGKEDGLKEYIAGIKSQPLPGPLPAPSAMPAPSTATPATVPSSSTGTGAGNGSTATTMTPTTTTTATPSATTTPAPAKATTTTTMPAKTTTTTKTTTTPKTTTPAKTTPKKKAHAGGH
jgi:hypothetical protein